MFHNYKIKLIEVIIMKFETKNITLIEEIETKEAEELKTQFKKNIVLYILFHYVY